MIAARNIWNDFSHLFFPQICAGCGNDTRGIQSPLCLRCINNLPVTNFHLHPNNHIEKYFWGKIPVEHATAMCHFSKDSLIQHLLHQLKYRGRKEIGYFLGKMMGRLLRESDFFDSVDLLVPLPLFAARLKKRGYNQAKVICDGMAETMQLAVLPDAMIRLSATETQTQKNRIERWQNMEGRFKTIKPHLLNNMHILLVDDVITTGATLEACGQEILSVNNTRLSIATVAYTV